MELELSCEVSQFGDNVRFGYRTMSDGIVVDVTRHDEYDAILLDDKDVERLYEYLEEYLGKDKESVPEVYTKSTEEVSELLEMSFKCASEPSGTLYTHFDEEDKEVYIRVNNNLEWDGDEADVYLSSEDALTMAKNIIKAFESVGIEAEPVVEEYEAASKADLNALEERYLSSLESIAEERSEIVSSINRDYADLKELKEELKELKEDFRGSMESVAKDWSKLNKDLNQVHVEISQIQNDIFNTNESTKVKLESLGKHIEGVSKEVVAAMEHLATRIDENGEEIQSLKVQEGIRKMKSRSVW